MNKEELELEIAKRIQDAAEESRTTNKFILQYLGDIPSALVKNEIAIKVLSRQAKLLPNLEEFHIIGCNIPRDAFRYLAAGLKSNASIALVEFSDFVLDDSAARDLALVIRSNRSITSLCITKATVTETGIKMIATAIKDSKTLETLALNETPLSNLACEHISEMLNGNTSLKFLHLQGCDITSHGLFVISQALKFNRSLQRLDLSQNSFDSNYGMENMGLALKDNSTLQVLNLSNNAINDEAATAIFMGLGRNTSVVTFAMGGIGVEEKEGTTLKSCSELAEMLKANKTLKNLSVFSFVFRNWGLRAIANGLKKNDTLEELVISGNMFDNEGAKHLLGALDVNKTLRSVILTKDDDGKAEKIRNPPSDGEDSDEDSDISEEDLMIISDEMFMEIKKKLIGRG